MRKGWGLIPELVWNSCVKKAPRTSDNSEVSADFTLFLPVSAYGDAENL